MTLIRRVPGIMDCDFNKPVNVLVHFTSDCTSDGHRHETISFTVKDHQVTMKFNPIQSIIDKERGFKYQKWHYIIDESEAYIPVEWLEKWAKEHGETMEMIEDWKKECNKIGDEAKRSAEKV
jgi:hypothetical protein